MDSRRKVTICQDCLALVRSAQTAHTSSRSRPWRLSTVARRDLSTRPTPHQDPTRPRHEVRPVGAQRRMVTDAARAANRESSSLNLQAIHMRVNELCASALRPEDRKMPSEQRVLYVLEQLEAIVHTIDQQSEDSREGPASPISGQSATSALLGSVNTQQTSALISKALVLNTISSGAEQVLRNPDIFITPSILKAYVDLQCLLQQPSSFPDIFSLYVYKARPSQSGTEKVSYSPVSTRSTKHPSSAVPAGIATAALDCAIKSHDLSLALDVIETSFCTPAFRNARIVREAGIPMAGATALPFVLWGLSSQIGALSPALSQATATNMAFAGLMTYVTTVGALGYITVTTTNDQMQRVTWAQGIPLWERWVRENERAAVDTVAQAWGFKNEHKRGEEEGEEWRYLREWIGMRSMMLDRVTLMEGME